MWTSDVSIRKDTLVNDADIKVISQINFNGNIWSRTRLLCWSTGPTDPILSRNRTIILQNFGQLAF